MEKEAIFRFYEELNDFLPAGHKKQEIRHRYTGNPSVKDTIEALGVPHTEIDLILINGKSVGFNARVNDGDRISVYPVFEAIDISPVIRLRPKALRVTRFICDVHLGKLARQLRMLGFDVVYERDEKDAAIIECALKDRRIILTRDQGLLKHKNVTHGYWIRSANSQEQIDEVIRRFDLCGQIMPFTRCMVCNGSIEKAAKDNIMGLIEKNTALFYNEFFKCCACHKIYWKGSHYKKMEKHIRELCKQSEKYSP